MVGHTGEETKKAFWDSRLSQSLRVGGSQLDRVVEREKKCWVLADKV